MLREVKNLEIVPASDYSLDDSVQAIIVAKNVAGIADKTDIPITGWGVFRTESDPYRPDYTTLENGIEADDEDGKATAEARAKELNDAEAMSPESANVEATQHAHTLSFRAARVALDGIQVQLKYQFAELADN